MEFVEAIKLALQSLWASKLRSILTLLGVVMGVASVIMVITLVNGANHYVSTKLSGYGADVFTISKQPSVIFSGAEYFKYQKRRQITIEDYQAISEGCKTCVETGALLNSTGKVVYNGKSSTNTDIRGYTWTMPDMNNITLAMGRSFTPTDEEHGTHNAIIGYDIIDNLVGDEDPIGKEIRVGGVPYTIIGVGDRQGKTLGQSQDNWVAIPITTYQHVYGTHDTITVYARAGNATDAMERAKDEARVLMRSRRHDAPGAPDSFEVESNDTFLDIWKNISQIFAFVVVAIASISLVVGGIVIMNIMLVSVTERTREIGVRKALGATQRDVLLQFLIESATMALVGGMIGVMAGVGVAKLITVVIGFPTTVQIWSVFLGLFVAGGVGIFFGVYPARKAAQLDPIVALRSEL